MRRGRETTKDMNHYSTEKIREQKRKDVKKATKKKEFSQKKEFKKMHKAITARQRKVVKRDDDNTKGVFRKIQKSRQYSK